MPITATGNMDYLIDSLRLHMGDTTSGSYVYTDDWMRTALVGSVDALTRWGGFKYYTASDNAVRQQGASFQFVEPPVIEPWDERPIILMAGLILKEGSLESFTWNLASWKDAEISYSNIQGGKTKEFSYKASWDELTQYLKPPQKRLNRGKKSHMQGYKGNPYENRGR